jgi:hypothetical protein
LVEQAVDYPTMNVISNFENLMVNPGLRLFSIWKFMGQHLFLLNIPIGKIVKLSSPTNVEATKYPQLWRQGVLGIICSCALQTGVLTDEHDFKKN